MSETTANEQDIDPIVRAEVARIWRGWIGMDPDLTQRERDRQIDAEAARLTQLIEEHIGDSSHGFRVEQWQEEHQGQEPDFLTAARLIESARQSARSLVLETELYPQVTPEIAEQTEADLEEIHAVALEEARRLREIHDPDRWRRHMVEVSELATRIVSRVWGASQPLDFMTLASALVQQRLEDNQRTPTTSADPLREELDQMIDEELRRSQTTPF
ncbi:hypothetical protein GS966_27675 [Rhodococcus hoagii]|nr:hypothetical protein [Prescottella equi]NKS10233.1 hypothetical protein [Prescottella equi]NKS35224.1 hypothetical protein [Prescottella equi]NKS62071.1 hypothetical protein [Prescottella equi]NKS68258.1 hypothetical protein [Prescottella equi]